MAAIKPFQIDIPDEVLKKVKQRLELAEFPTELSNAGRAYGSPLADVQRLTAYWREKFDWRTQEKKLNEVPQFTTDVHINGFGSINVHFVHQKSGVDGAIPLLFVHGWPGSFIEVIKMLPFLKGGDGRPAFDVVAPSLPNFGFSDAIKKPGFNLAHYAETCNKLMLALGYNEYVTQGGDWGHMITHVIGLRYPKHCKANHSNMPNIGGPDAGPPPDFSKLTPRERASMERAQWFRTEASGYFSLQTTRPMTLAYGLQDSPVATLAWIYEKLLDWTDDYPWTDDEVLTWISIYVFSRAGPGASVFIYYEAVHDKSLQFLGLNTKVQIPVGIAYFPKEIVALPEAMLQGIGDVKHASYFDKGGHFAAYERPEDLANDVAKFYGKDGPIPGIVGGKSG